MKRLYIYGVILSLLLGFSSCDKETEGISTKTTYATIEFDDFVVVSTGGDFTPAAVAMEGATEVNVEISGSVDVNTVGVYTITYSAVNSDGYKASSSQTVVVHNPAGTGRDVTGEIQDKNRTERTGVISLIEGTSNVYYCTDFAFGGTFPLYFEMNGDVMNVIPQPFKFGATGVDASYNAGDNEFSITVNPYDYSYNFQYK